MPAPKAAKALITPTEFSAEVRTITAAIAEQMLACGSPYISEIDQRKVNLMAKKMANGFVLRVGEPIVFDKTGGLQDGNHRLWAVVQSGVPLTTVVVYGAELSAWRYFRQGTPKTKIEPRALHMDRWERWGLSKGVTGLFKF